MRSIATIDFANRNNFSVLNAASQSNQLIVYMLPLSDQKSNLKIEIIGSNGEIFTSEILRIENGESLIFLDYEIPIQYWTLSGTMKIRLLSDESNSEYINFNIPKQITKNSQIKYNHGSFTIENIETQSNTLPIASETRLGGIKVGATLNIQSDGTLNANEGEGIEPITNTELEAMLV